MLAPEQVRAARLHALRNAVVHGGRADPKALMGRLLGDFADLRKRAAEVKEEVAKIIDSVNSLSPEQQKVELDSLGGAPKEAKRGPEGPPVLPDLPGAQRGRVVMRLAPYPSGPLHIGNARMVILNDEYVKRTDGKLLLVFDDTIGSEEKRPILEGYDLIREGLDWLGVRIADTVYKSDRLEKYYIWGRRFIETGGAYSCACPADLLRKNREAGLACAHRDEGKDRTLENFEKMLRGEFAPGEMCVRAKTDIAHPNPAFRDRVIFRISDREHPRVGTKYRVWPLLEFAFAVDDQELGITHVIRGKDLMIEDEMELFIWSKLGMKPVPFIHYGLIRVAEAKLSKSKAQAEVRSGEYIGWDDPRTWSLQALRSRGIRPEAVRAFVLGFGLSLSDIEVPADVLYAENRKLVDATAPRLFFVPDPVELDFEGPALGQLQAGEEALRRLENLGERAGLEKQIEELGRLLQRGGSPTEPPPGDREERRAIGDLLATLERFIHMYEGVDDRHSGTGAQLLLKLRRHPDNDSLGTRLAPVGTRLFVSKADLEKHRDNEVRLKDYCNVRFDGPKASATTLENKDVPKVQWVSGSGIPCTVLMVDGSEVKGVVEFAVNDHRPREIVQFERFGFVNLEEVSPGTVRARFAHK